MIKRFDNIGVAVTDFKRSAEWYRKLGFESQDGGGTGGSFQAGEAVLYIFETSSSESPRRRELDLIHNPPGIDHISFRVADVDTNHQELLARGVEIEEGPTNQDWGSRTITLLDPDGNRIYFLGPLKE
jgi:catechol 2,3-dioxygenase-like lactoylglutathione lyase family enzyme